jgi:hypothetical protein
MRATRLHDVRTRAALSCAAIAGLAVACLGAEKSAAAAEPVRLSWVRGEGAEGCAGEPQIAERVKARLGGSPFSASAQRSIEALVARAEKGFRVVIYVRGADGTLAGSREISSEAAGCASIEAASVLAIALAIDPDAGTSAPPADSAAGAKAPGEVQGGDGAGLGSPQQNPIPTAATSAQGGANVPAFGPGSTPPGAAIAPARAGRIASPSTPPPRPTIDMRGAGVALRGGAGLGLLPSVSAALEIAGHVALSERVQLAAEALWLPEARTADKHFGFGLTAFSLGACGVIASARAVELAACGLVWAGALHAVVYDLSPTGPGDYAWAGASAAPRLRIKLSPHVHWELGVHVVVPFVRRAFSVIGWKDPVFQEPPVTAIPFGGLGVHFP